MGLEDIKSSLGIEYNESDDDKSGWDEEHYEYHCSGCKEPHPSYWKTVIESPQWKEWDSGAGHPGHKAGFDVDECRECNWISQRHFQEFLKWVISHQAKK